MAEKRACSVCGSLHSMDELTEFDDSFLCEICLHTETSRCQRCGERIWMDDNAGDGVTPLCQNCYDRYYTSCEDCGRVILQDDAYYENYDDYEARCYHCHCRHADQRVIHDYYYKPEPEFFGEGSRYYGVELEVDDGGESNSNAAKIIEVANSVEEHIYIKHDGSLNSGFEIVSHPMTKDYHMDCMPWAAVLAKAKELGYRSHQSGTCGLHVHVNRTALPKATELNKQLPKKAIYAKFQMNTAAKDRFDADISRISIVGEISPRTVGIAAGESIASIFVLLVSLKHKDFQANTIAQISKLIDQNMLLVLEHEGQQKLAIYYTKLIQTDWMPADNFTITLKGLDLDAVWENLIVQVGGITIQTGNTLDQQIVADEKQAKLEKEIARLEKLARAEKQPKKKFELVQQINQLKKEKG